MGSFALNSQRLVTYDISKMSRFLSFTDKTGGKFRKKSTKNSSVSSFISHWWVLMTPFMVLLDDISSIYKIKEGILKKIIFSHFMAIFRSKFSRFFSFRYNFELKMAIKWLKSFFQKPPLIRSSSYFPIKPQMG